MTFKYRQFGSGNAAEFPELDNELFERQVRAQYFDLPTGGRVYRIPEADLAKLPQDESGPYLGNPDVGYSLYDMPDAEQYRAQMKAPAWLPVLPLGFVKMPSFAGQTPDQMLDTFAAAKGIDVPDFVRAMVNDFAARPVQDDPPKRKKK